MPGIAGMGTTYNLPNYVGELFQLSTEDTPFLSAIGGLTGGEDTGSMIFTGQTTDLRDADATPQRLEWDDAPPANGRNRIPGHNVLEIHQEQVSVSYTKQGATRQLTGTDPMQAGVQPVTDELTFQTSTEIKSIARAVEKSFIVGTYNPVPRPHLGSE